MWYIIIMYKKVLYELVIWIKKFKYNIIVQTNNILIVQ